MLAACLPSRFFTIQLSGSETGAFLATLNFLLNLVSPLLPRPVGWWGRVGDEGKAQNGVGGVLVGAQESLIWISSGHLCTAASSSRFLGFSMRPQAFSFEEVSPVSRLDGILT